MSILSNKNISIVDQKFISFLTSPTNPPSTTMIQRTLLRQSRALRTCIKPSSPRSTILPSHRFPTQLVASSRPLFTRRWYSAEVEKNGAAETATEGEKVEGEKAEEAGEAENPLAAELEKKNKEIIELKVCSLKLLTTVRKYTDCPTGQIPPLNS